jgi:hypothetical protein
MNLTKAKHWEGTYEPKDISDPIRCLHDEDAEKLELKLCGYDLPGWYFWDEIWCNLHGPFSTFEECSEALKNYAKAL